MKGRLISVSWAARELDLGFFSSLLQTLNRHRILTQIDALILLELLQQPLDQPLVDIVATQMSVAVGGLDLDHTLAHLENRDIESAAAKVVDGDQLVSRLVQTVGQRRCRRLVDQSFHLQSSNLACVLGRLSLGIVEVGRHRDDGPFDLFAQSSLQPPA